MAFRNYLIQLVVSVVIVGTALTLTLAYGQSTKDKALMSKAQPKVSSD